MLVVGLTGGIGSGKSTVASMFARLGISIIDTDMIARELVEKGSPTLRAIVAQFGTNILDSNGELDRQAMRSRIFTHNDERKRLEAILHPAIRQEVREQLARLDESYCIVVIPLLFESRQQDLVDCILVVDSSEQLQLQRSMLRDNSDETGIRNIINSQVDRQHRLKHSDYIIHNDGDLPSLQKQVNELHQQFLHQAKP